jgi:hypothetical protein
MPAFFIKLPWYDLIFSRMPAYSQDFTDKILFLSITYFPLTITRLFLALFPTAGVLLSYRRKLGSLRINQAKPLIKYLAREVLQTMFIPYRSIRMNKSD